ncbi:PRP1 splicing factor, N-terminal-domain-containing protein [Chytriomyces sp. MP71]|nr:PRP1 splicing factor, N-terminal-domain-containing protein [Chytriomyces sp. MP71]
MFTQKPALAPDFLSKKPPPNYIAGLGRGATGFTTRSDIGPAREQVPDMPVPGEAIGPMAPGSMPDQQQQQQQQQKKKDPDDDDERFQDPDNETGLFNTAPYEADDEEADRIYEQVDKAMDERRRARREAREKEELERYRKERPKIQQQFADLKRGLAAVSNEEWAALPEVGDLVRKKGAKKNLRPDRYTPTPDLITVGSGFGATASDAASGYATSIDPRMMGGLSTPAGTASVTGTDTSVDLAQFGASRNKILGLKLAQVSDSKSGQSTVDPKGYLTDLNSMVTKTDAEISDIKKARQLLRSVITTNPKHAPGWIAAARLEEVAQKIVAARELAAKGCEECPKSEDIWLESARLNTTENAKIILATAIRHIPTSVKIWLRAESYEQDPKAKKRVLRRALEFIPNSVKIWKAAVSLEEDEDDARILLSRAVDCVPLSTELWLALARLESYENAKKVLNRARAAIPTSHEVWITAAKLEEQAGHARNVDAIIPRAVTTLAQKGSALDRDAWISEAETCEREGFVGTAQAIVTAAVGMDVEEEDREATWLEDAESCVSRGAVATARAIYAHALQVFPEEDGIWRKAAMLEKNHGSRESMEEVLQRAVKYCPQAEVLWLMAAKEKWLSGDLKGAKGILESAFEANPNSEQIWLAAIKLEVETGEYGRAQLLLQRARVKADTDRVWMKSAMLERQLGNLPAAMALLEEAIKKFPSFGKLWMIKSQIEEMQDNPAGARDTLAKALKAVPKSSPSSITLWILASRLEERAGHLTKARALLEKARLLNPREPELWCEAVRVESRAGNQAIAEALTSKALQECPSSGLLWSEAILTESRPQRKARSRDALMKCENDPMVLVTVARLFWVERKPEKARNWFARAVKANPDLGDSWAWWLKFESVQEGGERERLMADVIAKCVAAEPHHGEKWQACAKDLKNVGKSTEELLRMIAATLPVTL